MHTPSAQFLAVCPTDGLGRFFRAVDRTTPDRIPEIAGQHGIELVP